MADGGDGPYLVPADETWERLRERSRAGALRAEISGRSLEFDPQHPRECTPASTPAVVFTPTPEGHGNFYPASYRRILKNPAWLCRLDKAYTASRHLPHSRDRRRAELECAASSDALLMNIFCHPGTLRSPKLRALLQLAPEATPRFGVRTYIPLRGGHLDRTEADMQLGDLLVEAKLSESGFGEARPALLERYPGFDAAFETDELPARLGRFRCYQLLRGVLAAQHHGCRFALFCDERRPDLVEDWFRVLRAVRAHQLRQSLLLVTWQEIAVCLPKTLAAFLWNKYGIAPPRG